MGACVGNVYKQPPPLPHTHTRTVVEVHRDAVLPQLRPGRLEAAQQARLLVLLPVLLFLLQLASRCQARGVAVPALVQISVDWGLGWW